MTPQSFLRVTVIGLAASPLFVLPAIAQTNAPPPQPPPGTALSGTPQSVPTQPVASSPSGQVTQTPGNTSAAAAPNASADFPKLAVQAVNAMFTPNDTPVEATGKPLAGTGTWGVQTKFPDGIPKVCTDARVPCLKVVYRVPEDKLVCDWTVGFLTVAKPQPDGTIKHDLQEIVLDENEPAARYTIRKAWPNEPWPRPVVYKQADYPDLARASGIGGAVVVRIDVGADGVIKNVEAETGPAMLRASVVAAVKQWKYAPLAVGNQHTAFRVEEQFNFNVAGPNISAGMDPSGKVVMQQDDPHYAPGFRSNGASSGQWEQCSSGGCSISSPATPK